MDGRGFLVKAGGPGRKYGARIYGRERVLARLGAVDSAGVCWMDEEEAV